MCRSSRTLALQRFPVAVRVYIGHPLEGCLVSGWGLVLVLVLEDQGLKF